MQIAESCSTSKTERTLPKGCNIGRLCPFCPFCPVVKYEKRIEVGSGFSGIEPLYNNKNNNNLTIIYFNDIKTPYPCRPQGQFYYFAATSLKYAFEQDLNHRFCPHPRLFLSKKEKTVVEIVSTTVTVMANVTLFDTMHHDFISWCIFSANISLIWRTMGQKGQATED